MNDHCLRVPLQMFIIPWPLNTYLIMHAKNLPSTCDVYAFIWIGILLIISSISLIELLKVKELRNFSYMIKI